MIKTPRRYCADLQAPTTIRINTISFSLLGLIGLQDDLHLMQ